MNNRRMQKLHTPVVHSPQAVEKDAGNWKTLYMTIALER